MSDRSATRLPQRATTTAALVLALACALAACGGAPAGTDGQVPEGKPQARLPTATLRSGGASIEVEIAATDAQRQAGLMFRTGLADGQGMIFVYGEDRRMSFWMKNTLIPLSIAFLSAEGEIRELRDMVPLSLAPVDSGRYARYAIEAPLGWFARAGLGVGDRFELPPGFPPAVK